MADEAKQDDQPPFENDKNVTENNENANSTRRVNTLITAESLYLVLAMWMEMFPKPNSTSEDAVKSGDLYREIGCVLVHKNDRLLAIDRSRDGVHGLARILVKNHDKTTDCKVFVSRKPCTYCVKLLVKAGISHISYPPVEPEFYNDKEEKHIAALLEAAQVTQRVFIPETRKDLPTTEEEELVNEGISCEIKEYIQKVLGRFWNEDCARSMSVQSTEESYCKFENLVKWFARIYLPLEHSKFRSFSPNKGHSLKHEEQEKRNFDPENDSHHEKIAKHFLCLATMTIQHTVEPKTGVGCVIMKENELVGVGWNDFPSKVIEEGFHNASDKERDKKYPLFVHAEQNALLMRNLTDVTGGVLFVTKTPCHECTPLVKVSGIETVVLATSLEPIKEKYRLNYEVFQEEIGHGTFLCYENAHH